MLFAQAAVSVTNDTELDLHKTTPDSTWSCTTSGIQKYAVGPVDPDISPKKKSLPTSGCPDLCRCSCHPVL